MYKSKLQELCHQNSWLLPVYSAVKDGPDHCPRFTATVTVGGLPFETPKDVCESSKEAQNLAAKMAFDHFNASQQGMPPAITSSPPTLFSPGFPTSISSLDVRPATNDRLQQKQGDNSQTSLPQQPPFVHSDESRPKGALHLYKNRLQHYAQKKNLTLPEYSCKFDGPPHARQFRASVTIEGQTYESPEYFSTLKDAEHAAAKVAFESLSIDEIQEDDGLYKTLLQELAQKEGFCFPSYSTMKTGPSHMPTFVSTVEVGGELFQGRECKTKKQSEMNAAKVAYDGLMERRKIHTSSPGDDMKEKTEVTPATLEPIIGSGLQQNTGSCNAIQAHVELTADILGGIPTNSCLLSPGSHRNEAMKASYSVVTYDLQQDVQPKPLVTHIENNGEVKGIEMNAKRDRYSASPDNVPCLPETFHPTHPLPDGPSSHYASSEDSANCLVESDTERQAECCSRPGTKILVYPRSSTMTVPEGASILPCTDDKWTAMKVEMNQDP